MACNRCQELEERVAFAELARDNACTQRDELQDRSKLARASAGRRVGALVDLIRRLCAQVPEDTKARATVRLAEILDKDHADIDWVSEQLNDPIVAREVGREETTQAIVEKLRHGDYAQAADFVEFGRLDCCAQCGGPLTAGQAVFCSMSCVEQARE